MIPWALASDHFGRKPCLIVSLCGTAVATAVFGFSRTLRDMLLWRAVAGAFSGSSVVLRTLFSEVTAEAHQARALSYYAFAGNIALLIGPILGGSFSQPAQQFPALFRGVRPLVEVSVALMHRTRSQLTSFAVSLCPAWSDRRWSSSHRIG